MSYIYHDLTEVHSPDPTSQDIFQLSLRELVYRAQVGQLPDSVLFEFLQHLPQETLRQVVQKIAGTDTSFIMTFTKQVKLVDAVLNNLVHPDGRLKHDSDDLGVSLKDALTMSLQISKIMVNDLPKLYQMDRLQRLENALADVMETEMTKDQRDKVLLRIKELSESN